ncbi:MAG TPA: four helix bundle protein [Gemmatimonadaceae bacterium]|nr:four helix bundle protein [Gemmatimonadaceae bacterium]
MSDFRKLRAWRAAQTLVIDTYRVSRGMRGPQSRNLADQLNRAAMSVPRNTIEGNEHDSPRERARFFRYAIASVSEGEGHMQTAVDLEMMPREEFENLVSQVVEVRKMLYGLLRGLDGTQ